MDIQTIDQQYNRLRQEAQKVVAHGIQVLAPRLKNRKRIRRD